MPRANITDSLRADVHAIVETILDEVLQARETALLAKEARQLSLQWYIPKQPKSDVAVIFGGGLDRMEILKGLVLTYLVGEHDLSLRQFDGLLAELRKEIRVKWLREDSLARRAALPKPKPSEPPKRKPSKREDKQYPMQYGFKKSKKKPRLPWKKLRDA